MSLWQESTFIPNSYCNSFHLRLSFRAKRGICFSLLVWSCKPSRFLPPLGKTRMRLPVA